MYRGFFTIHVCLFTPARARLFIMGETRAGVLRFRYPGEHGKGR